MAFLNANSHVYARCDEQLQQSEKLSIRTFDINSSSSDVYWLTKFWPSFSNICHIASLTTELSDISKPQRHTHNTHAYSTHENKLCPTTTRFTKLHSKPKTTKTELLGKEILKFQPSPVLNQYVNTSWIDCQLCFKSSWLLILMLKKKFGISLMATCGQEKHSIKSQYCSNITNN